MTVGRALSPTRTHTYIYTLTHAHCIYSYTKTHTHTQYTKFDRDILQIKILTKARAFDAAIDFYQYGYNVVSGDELNIIDSLKQLATAPSRSRATVQYNLFSNFFNSPDYADKMVNDLLNLRAPYDKLTTDQTMRMVTGTLQFSVMYMAILDRLYSAISKCREGEGVEDSESIVNTSVQLLDQAAAQYIGSIEGSDPGGRAAGQLLFGSSKELCTNFDTCIELGNSETNDQVIDAFKDISNKLTLGNCDAVEEAVENDVTPLLIVPLIQGALYTAVALDKPDVSADDDMRGLSQAYADSLLPLLDNVDDTSTFDIEQNLVYRADSDPVPDGANAVFAAFQTIIPKMQVPPLGAKCSTIGTYQSPDTVYANVCQLVDGGTRVPTVPLGAPTVPPTPAPLQPIAQEPVIPSLSDLGLGVYNFTTNVGAM